MNQLWYDSPGNTRVDIQLQNGGANVCCNFHETQGPPGLHCAQLHEESQSKPVPSRHYNRLALQKRVYLLHYNKQGTAPLWLARPVRTSRRAKCKIASSINWSTMAHESEVSAFVKPRICRRLMHIGYRTLHSTFSLSLSLSVSFLCCCNYQIWVTMSKC